MIRPDLQLPLRRLCVLRSSNRKKAKVSLQWPLGNTNPHRGSKTSGMESEDSMGAMGSNGSSFGLGALLGGSVSGAPKGPSARPSGWRRDAPIRKDALLSGPLPSLRRRMEEVEAAEEAGNGDTAAPNGGGGFRSCFSRVLRPGAQQRGYRHAGRMHIAQCLDIADHGRLLLVAGKVRMPVVDKKQSGLQYAGYLSVWQVRPPSSAIFPTAKAFHIKAEKWLYVVQRHRCTVMCIYVYTSIYTHSHTYIHTYMYTFTTTDIHRYMYA